MHSRDSSSHVLYVNGTDENIFKISIFSTGQTGTGENNVIRIYS
jgi:uncharacterized protein YukJ